MTPHRPVPERGRSRLRLAVLVAALLAGPLLAELSVRWALFGSSSLARDWGGELRRPGLYADPRRHEDFWLLRRLFAGEAVRYAGPAHPHAELGWSSGRFDAEEYWHDRVRLVRGRRPLLFYGASFAQQEYGELLERSRLGERFAPLVYGVGGFGLDQVVMLAERSLPLYAADDPVAVVALAVDDDLDRCVLSLRDWPKPRFELDGEGALRLVPVPTLDLRRYLETHPLALRSFVWSHLRFGATWLPDAVAGRLAGEEAHRARVEAVAGALLRRLQDALDACGVPAVYLLFNNVDALDAGASRGWREELVIGVLEARGAPWIRTRELYQAAAAANAESPSAYYQGAAGERPGHPNARGREVVLPALVEAVEALAR